MVKSVKLAYIAGVFLVVAGFVMVVVVAITERTIVEGCSNGSICNHYDVNWGLLVAAVGVIWTGIAGLVAGYGRSKNRSFFPLFVAALFIPFPISLLVLAVTSTVGTPAVAPVPGAFFVDRHDAWVYVAAHHISSPRPSANSRRGPGNRRDTAPPARGRRLPAITAV